MYAVFFRSAAVRRNVLRKKFWNQVSNKVPKLKDADFSGEASYKIANSDVSSSSNITIKMNFDTKLQTVDKDQLKMSMTSTLNMLGQTMDMNMYYSDGYYYMNTNGTKQKMKMDIAGLQKQIQSTTGQTSLPAKILQRSENLVKKDGKYCSENTVSIMMD